jgi:CheY-like chemotaxis protein
MQAVSEIPGDLSGSRVGMLGFPPGPAGELGDALKRAACLTSNLPTARDDLSDPLESYDIVIVWAGEDGPSPRLAELLLTSQRWLLFGPEERIRQNASLYLRADDVVFTPYSLSESLFRIYRTMYRMNIVSHPSTRRKNPMLLVADDDPGIIMLLESVLRIRDWECHFVTNGLQALVLARKLLPDLLVLDIEMPLMSGLEALKRIRRDAKTSRVKILLLTGSSDQKDVQEGLSFGADDYLAKPFSHLTLLHRVRKLLYSSSTVPPVKAE